MKTAVMIADDHGVLRAGLAALLNAEADIDVVGEADTGQKAITMALEKKPDVILMDLSMPEMGGIDATRKIHQLIPTARILILTIHEDKYLMHEALSSGAMGYILKKALKEDLINAIHTVMRNEIYLQSSMAKLLFIDTPIPAQENNDFKQEVLTSREEEVLKFIAQGYTNNQTAKFLNISVRTVEYHRRNITSKLNIHSRVELMKYAEDIGLI